MLVYDKYNIAYVAVETVAGGVPLDPETIKGWTTYLSGGIPNPAFAQEVAEQVQVELDKESEPEEAKKGYSGFRRDKNGIYIPWFVIRAWYKETADSSGLYKETRGQSLRQVVENIHINPTRLYLAKQADGIAEIRGSVKDPNGFKKSIIRFMEFLKNPIVEFTAYTVHNGASRLIKPDNMYSIAKFAEHVQLGSGRGVGFGKMMLLKFDYQGQVEDPYEEIEDSISIKAIRAEALQKLGLNKPLINLGPKQTQTNEPRPTKRLVDEVIEIIEEGRTKPKHKPVRPKKAS